MSNVQQQTREAYDRGDPVEVITYYGNGSTKLERVQSATVVETLRAAVRCRFEDGSVRNIPFKHVRKSAIVVPEVVQVAPIVEKRRTPPVAAQLLGVIAVPSGQPPPAVPKPATPAASVQLADIDAWLRMGAEMLQPLDFKIADLRQHGEGLDAEKEAIERERELVSAELKTLFEQRERVARLVGAGLPERKG